MAVLNSSLLLDKVMALITLTKMWGILSAHGLLRVLLEKLHTMLSISIFIAVIIWWFIFFFMPLPSFFGE